MKVFVRRSADGPAGRAYDSRTPRGREGKCRRPRAGGANGRPEGAKRAGDGLLDERRLGSFAVRAAEGNAVAVLEDKDGLDGVPAVEQGQPLPDVGQDDPAEKQIPILQSSDLRPISGDKLSGRGHPATLFSHEQDGNEVGLFIA